MNKEKQFNRKFELNNLLRQHKQALAGLQLRIDSRAGLKPLLNAIAVTIVTERE
ncbi:MAG: hypothetical protein COB33_014585 [Thiotrichaceae bacterium]|nr:hypothetical protein [Thiotrichaceae bacterium]